ncbi:MAG: DUF5666 domain-containing protein [Anaerolineae bacterium]|nr:DUF5666 domain-containing protein [Anaerolineae bacterium]MDW7991375.1 DUF5666 domain-containing protein [Anaerolineae bacterium]
MRRWILLLLVAVIVAMTATPALATGKTPPKRQPFNLVGRITAVDTGAGTVTVEVLRGNRVVKPFIGKTVTVQTDAATRFLKKMEMGIVPISLADLQVGDAVSVQGRRAGEVWTAYRITVGASLYHLP